MIYVQLNSDGLVVSAGTSYAEPATLPEGLVVFPFDLPIPEILRYAFNYTSSTFVWVGDPPASSKWDKISFSWVIEPITLAEAQQVKRAEIDRARDMACHENITAHGTQWQSDERSQRLLSDVITLASAGLPLPPYWRDAHDVNMAVTSLADLLTIAGAMAAQTQNAYSKSWAMKAEVASATTIEQVAAIVWQ